MREQNHHEILAMVSNFDEPLKDYELADTQIKEHKQAGENIIANIDAMVKKLDVDLQEIQETLSDLSQSEEENNWKKSNLKYLKAVNKLKAKQQEVQEATEEKNDAQFDKEKAESGEKASNLKLLVKKYRVAEKKYRDIKADIERLRHSPELTEIAEKEKEVAKGVQEKWNLVYERLKIIQNQYQTYVVKMKAMVAQKDEKYNDLSTRIGGLDAVLKRLASDIKAYETERDRMKEKYGYLIQSKPEVVYEGLLNEEKELLKKIKEAETAERTLERQKEELTLLLGNMRSEIQRVKMDKKETERKQKIQLRKQMEWMNELSKILKLSREERGFTYEWLYSMVPSLEDLHEKRTKRLHQLTIELLKVEEQLQISDKEHFVPNADIQKISDMLTDKGIYFQTGTQFLLELSESERADYNRNNPSLKYSIIVHVQNLQDLKNKINLGEDLLQSPVPLVEAKSLNSPSMNSMFLFTNQADEFVEKPAAWNEYLLSILQTKEELDKHILKNEQDIQDITRLKNRIIEINQEESAERLSQLASDLETALEIKRGEERDKFQELEALKEAIEEAKQTQRINQDLVKERGNAQKQVEAFMEKSSKYRGDKEEHHSLLQDMEGKRVKQEKLKSRMDEMKTEMETWQISYSDWKAAQNTGITHIQKIVEGAQFPMEVDVAVGEELILPILPEVLEDILLDVNEYDSLRQTLEQKSIQIATLTGENRGNLENLQTSKKILLSEDLQGLEYPTPDEPVNVLETQKKKAEEKARKAREAYRDSDKNVTALAGVVKTMQKQVDDIIEDIIEDLGRGVEVWENVDFDTMTEVIAEESASIQREIEENESKEAKINDAKHTLEKERPTLAAKLDIQGPVFFTIAADLSDHLIEKISEMVREWSKQFDIRKRRRVEALNSLDRVKKRSIEDIKESSWEEKTKLNIREQFNLIDANNLTATKETLDSIRVYSNFELDSLEEDKKKGMEARERWVKYAAQFSSNILKSIYEMTEAMVITNRGGFDFPLVKIKNKRKLPNKTEEYKAPLEKFFNRAIEKVNATGKQVETITNRELNQIVNIADIVYSALGNQYPKFDIYNLDQENMFVYDAARSEYYIDWEVLNEGSDTSAAGSGGQRVSGRTIMFLMMMSHKRNVTEKDWQFIYMDNPFANAVSASVVDPIFAITEALKYQLIVFAPPELMKAEISMKFHSVNDLYFEKQENGKHRVAVSRRHYLNPTPFMTKEFETEVIDYSPVKNKDYEQGEFVF